MNMAREILCRTTSWKWCSRLRLHQTWDQSLYTPTPLGGVGVSNRSSEHKIQPWANPKKVQTRSCGKLQPATSIQKNDCGFSHQRFASQCGQRQPAMSQASKSDSLSKPTGRSLSVALDSRRCVIHLCVYIHTYIHACMHAYIHTYIHTYIFQARATHDARCLQCRIIQVSKKTRRQDSLKGYPLSTLYAYIYIYICTHMAVCQIIGHAK